ncbi:hypothetical protein [Streptomyces sp. NPDC058612]
MRPRVLAVENSTGEGAGSMDVFCGIDWAEGHVRHEALEVERG